MLLRPALILLALLPSATPALPGAPRAMRFVFTGAVTQPGGRPVAGARVVLEGARGAVATADAEGRYVLAHVVPDVTALAVPVRLVLRASHRGWNLALPSGAAALAVQLRRVPVAGDGALVEVRSNDAGVAKAVARALEAGGEAVVALDAHFTRLVGREDRAAPELTALEVVALAAPPAPRESLPAPPPAAPGASPPAPASPPERPESLRLFPSAPEPGAVRDSPPAARDTAPAARGVAAAPALPPAPPRSAAADTALRPGFRVSVRPGTAAPAPAGAGAAAPEVSPLRVALGRAVRDVPASGADSGECHCRVSGTVEVRSERPVRGRPRVVVSLAGRPASRDTVAIFMGPPRAFDLGRVPCGRHELEVRPLGSRLARIAPDSLGFTCAAGGARQFRVVLEPR